MFSKKNFFLTYFKFVTLKSKIFTIRRHFYVPVRSIVQYEKSPLKHFNLVKKKNKVFFYKIFKLL